MTKKIEIMHNKKLELIALKQELKELKKENYKLTYKLNEVRKAIELIKSLMIPII